MFKCHEMVLSASNTCHRIPFHPNEFERISATKKWVILNVNDDEPPSINELLKIFNADGDRLETDKIIAENIHKWLETNKVCPGDMFNAVHKKRNQVQFASLLAFLYLYGIGTIINQEKAFQWYKRTAETEQFCENDEGSDIHANKETMKLAFTKKDCDKNHQTSRYASAAVQYNLGRCYYDSIGTVEDIEKAFFWFSKSAKGGYRAAQNALGDCFQNGKGTIQDSGAAFFWYKKSALGGSFTAAYKFGKCFQTGERTNRDLHEAIRWAHIAVKNGNKFAKKQLGSFLSKQTR
ncbi:hypothetical protein G9A89_000988 [Geosiphon pyriformis]|nr:hypothetical protein G9A89_000988 [Geosiphon pyriformis]